MDAPTTSVVYDADALLASEANDRRFRIVHRQMLDEARHIIVPAPVLTQVWRGGARQALLARILRSCVVEPTTEQVAKYGGVLLAKTRTSDAVDAIVAASALLRDALIITSDPDDLSLLWRAAETGKRPKILAI
jgi:predicted nucleic acid-binding protein